MIPGRLTVIVPSRNEVFLAPTVRDVIAQARGDLEVIVTLDGGVIYEPLPDDPRVRVLSFVPKRGMRDAVNAAVEASTGEFVMKLDAHCRVSEGFDVVLAANTEPDWIVIPRRYALDGETWQALHHRTPVDAHYLSYPWERPDDPTCGLHGTPWPARGAAHADVPIDEELCTQGSCWWFHRSYWPQIGPLDRAHLGPNVQESTETSLRCWLSGGRQMVNKLAWYAHLAKGSRGRGYVVSRREHKRAREYCHWLFMTDQPFRGKTQTMRWLIERFDATGIPVPTWPRSTTGQLDWDQVDRDTQQYVQRSAQVMQ